MSLDPIAVIIHSIFGFGTGYEKRTGSLKGHEEQAVDHMASTGRMACNIYSYSRTEYLLDNAVSSFFAGMGTGAEITTLREIVFYTPCVLALACPILSFIFVIVRDNILYECAVELANDIEADLTAKADSSMKCYRKVCPNCGAVSTSSLKHCNSCGTSLEVLDSTMGLGTFKFYRDDNL